MTIKETKETKIDCPVCHEKIMTKEQKKFINYTEYFCKNGVCRFHIGTSAWDVYSGFLKKEYKKIPSDNESHFKIYSSKIVFSQIIDINNITYHKWWRASDNCTRTFLSLQDMIEKSVTIVSAFGYDPDFYSPTLEQDLIKKFHKIALMS